MRNYKGKNNPFYGKHHTKETRRKISLAQKGKHPCKFKGKTYEEIYGKDKAKRLKDNHSRQMTKYNIPKVELKRLYWTEKISLSQIAERYGASLITIYKRMKKYNIPLRSISEGDKIRFRNPEYIKRISKIRKEGNSIQNIIRNHHIRPNKLEQKLINIIKKYNLPYRYTGDGKFWVEDINPDFVECNGKKIAIEVFGDYWHSPLLNSKIKWSRTFEGRQKIYRKYGWSCIIIWEDELVQLPEEKIVMKLGV